MLTSFFNKNCCKSGSSSSLNSLLGLELLVTWLRRLVMIVSKYFMVKVQPRLIDFKLIWCNINGSGSIVTTPDFSKVAILRRFTFLLYILFNTILKKDMNINFNFICNILKQIYLILFRIRKKFKRNFCGKKKLTFSNSINLLLTSYDNSKFLKIFCLRKFWTFKPISYLKIINLSTYVRTYNFGWWHFLEIYSRKSSLSYSNHFWQFCVRTYVDLWKIIHFCTSTIISNLSIYILVISRMLVILFHCGRGVWVQNLCCWVRQKIKID